MQSKPTLFMSTELRRSLDGKLKQQLENFRLGEEFLRGSFAYKSGHQIQLSACDAVAVMSALLESFSVEAPIPKLLLQDDTEAGDDEVHDRDEVERNTLRDWKSNSFNQAYDFLSFRGNDKADELFKHGLGLAKNLQQMIMTEFEAIMVNKNMIKTTGDFRYCLLESLTPSLARALVRPEHLRRLAQLLVDAHTARNKWTGKSAKPFVLGARVRSTGSYHFVGLPSVSEVNVHNHFLCYFRQASDEIQARFRATGFGSPCVQVWVDNAQSFLIALHDIINREGNIIQEA